MRRFYKILLILFVSVFVLLILYAAPWTRPWMESNIGPPLESTFGTVTTAITTSFIWQHYVIPFPNQLLIGAVILGFPIAWLVHKSFNFVRAKAISSASRETGLGGREVFKEPISSPSYTPPAQVKETPQPAAPAPPPPEQPKPET